MTDKVFNNRYRLTDRIGIGGMAEVYRAYDEVLGRTVAVKIMLPQYAADPSFAKRFRQEAAAAANLQSPYIVNVYDWGQDEDIYYIVMEYVRGSDLKTAIVERGSINQRKVAEIGAQVCQALSVAHNLDIIHRDIKPQNIMIQPDGNVKVMDFGIARAKNSVKTQTASVLGTAHYISPEQAQGKELTPASDIYSLGVVLYEAATGYLPFDGPDAVSVAMQQVNNLPLPPHSYNPDIDPDLEDIIMKALEKRPTDRFATANDMRLALNDYLAGRPVDLGVGFSQAETAMMGSIPAAGMSQGAKAGAKMGGIADGTAIMPAAMKPVAQSASSTNYRASTPNKKDSSSKKTAGIVIGIIAALVVIGGIVFFLVSSQKPAGDPVPDVTGLTIDAATQKLQDAGFDIGTTTEDYSADIAAGLVVSQDPKAGDPASAGT
ncbi:MAG: Stk1 family PASTA domain-containing Ser/Thr kinase, partial [Eggerthellaceae bacterium]|nr:Stk1 family PASTA domain-containing Ser/Thr kinase [Eggerthellaceae bacterium]